MWMTNFYNWLNRTHNLDFFNNYYKTNKITKL